MRRAAIAVALLVSGCAGMSSEVLVGSKVSDSGFYGPTGPTFTFRARKALTDTTFCEYEHVSHLFAGRPFGASNEEDALDQVSCGVRFGDLQ